MTLRRLSRLRVAPLSLLQLLLVLLLANNWNGGGPYISSRSIILFVHSAAAASADNEKHYHPNTNAGDGDDQQDEEKHQQQQQQQEDDDALVIDLGDNVIYRRPFVRNYDSSIVALLHRHTRVMKKNSLWDEANWYMELGTAHRTLLEEKEQYQQSGGNMNNSQEGDYEGMPMDHAHRALHCYELAMSIYQGLRMQMAMDHHHPSDDVDEQLLHPQQQLDQHRSRIADLVNMQHHLANVYFAKAETYTLLIQKKSTTGTDKDDDTSNYRELALEYYQQALQLIDQTLPQVQLPQDAFLQQEMEITKAHVQLRLGVSAMNEYYRAVSQQQTPIVMSTSFTDENGNELDENTVQVLLEQLQNQGLDGIMGDDGGNGNNNAQQQQLLQNLLQMAGVNGGTTTNSDEEENDSSTTEDHHRSDDNTKNRQHHQQATTNTAQRSIQQATQYFQNAVNIFRQYKDNNNNNNERHLATSLHNLATAQLTQGRVDLASNYAHEALQCYHNQLSPQHLHAHLDAVEKYDTQIAISEIQYTLSAIHLQLGQYQSSQQMYQQAMDWFDEYNLPPPDSEGMGAGDYFAGGGGDDEASMQSMDLIREYEKALHDYKELVLDENDRTMMDEEAAEYYMNGQMYYQKDDGYEGDLHMSIGAMYMTQRDADTVLAMSHMLEAIRCYELAGESQSQNMASTKFNLSVLYLRNGDYQQSAELHGEALEIFEKVTDSGVNPLLGGMEDIQSLLQQQQQQYPQTGGDGSNDGDMGYDNQDGKDPSKISSDNENGAERNAEGSSDLKHESSAPPTVMIDLQSFLQQNDSIKEEL